MLNFLLDILVALAFAGCIYGITRAIGWHPNFRLIAGWTAVVMFAIASYGELSIAASGEARPHVDHVIPTLILAVVLFRFWPSVMLRFWPRTENDTPGSDVPEPQVVG